MEAWAYESGCPRQPDDTPIEFARQLAQAQPKMGATARSFTQLVNQSAYAPGTLSADCLPEVKKMWQSMEESTVSVSPAPA